VHLVRGQDGAVEDSEHGGRLPVVFGPSPDRRRRREPAESVSRQS